MDDSRPYALVIENLTKRYAGHGPLALDGLNLQIRKGEIFGLLGPNGAGKTTAISILSTLLPPSSGRVVICDIESIKHPGQARRCIGLVPQEIALYPEMTARENLMFFGRLQGMKGVDLQSGVGDALRTVGLEK